MIRLFHGLTPRRMSAAGPDGPPPTRPAATRSRRIRPSDTGRSLTLVRSLQAAADRKMWWAGGGSPEEIVVEGTGAWVTGMIRPLLKLEVERGRLRAVYVDHSGWPGHVLPDWANRAGKAFDLIDGEVYLDKNRPKDAARYAELEPAAVIVATPPSSHAEIAGTWVDRTPWVFVEKPFDVEPSRVQELIMAVGRSSLRTHVLGLDHYLACSEALLDSWPAVIAHLEGPPQTVRFVMAEEWPLELERLHTLSDGITADLLPHMLALLSSWADLSSLTDVTVAASGRYFPLLAKARDGRRVDVSDDFPSETFAWVTFTVRAHGTGDLIHCEAVVGKGFSETAKYMDVLGPRGNGLRIDFTKERADPADYPRRSMFLFAGPNATVGVTNVPDPHAPGRALPIIEGEMLKLKDEPYAELVDDLVKGGLDSMRTMLVLGEAEVLVTKLSEITRTIHANPEPVLLPLRRVRPSELFEGIVELPRRNPRSSDWPETAA